MWRRDDKRRGGHDPFDDFFGFDEIDREFERMRRYMDHIFSETMSSSQADIWGKPFVYGFSMRVGPDGKPRIEEFGNTPPQSTVSEEGRALMGREPLTDVIDTEESIIITAELPGVEKSDIDLRVTDESVTIDVSRPERNYHKEIALHHEVDPKSAKATCKNGILDITLKKVEREGQVGKKVKIE